MEWSGQEEQAAESVKKGDHSRRAAIRIYCTADNFQHPQNGDDDVELNVLGCRSTYWEQIVTSASAWLNIALRPQKPYGSLVSKHGA